MSDNHNSKEIYSRACKYLPGGVSRNTVYRKPHPHYVETAKGFLITDVEGITRTDFANNMASLIHGHAHPEIIKAVNEQMNKGTAYTMASEIEVKFAEHICSRSKSIEKIRFVNSGTEAVMAVIKAARAFTGKPKIAKAEGAYHGTYDFAEVSQTANPSNWGEETNPVSVPVAKGTPQSVLDEVIVFPFNDTEKTLSTLDRYADSIACVLIDPVPHRVGLIKAKEEFIKAVYEWTRRNNALLVFDEVVTYRVNYGGAQEFYDVMPDLTAMGKIIGGGFPAGAFGGRAEIMDVLDPGRVPLPFPHSGTFSANPITMTAGYTAMKLYDREAVEKLNKLADTAKEKIREAIKIADVPVSITGAGSMFRFHLKPEPPLTYREAYQSKEVLAVIGEILNHLYYEEKLLLINTFSCMLSTVMTDKEIDILSESLLRTFKILKPKIDQLQTK